MKLAVQKSFRGKFCPDPLKTVSKISIQILVQSEFTKIIKIEFSQKIYF